MVARKRNGVAGLWDDLVTLVAPVPGGGSVTTTNDAGQETTTYVDAQGNPTNDPSQAGGQSAFSTAGLEYTAGGLATAAAQGVTDDVSSIFSKIPWWGWGIAGLVGLSAVTMAVKSFVPHFNPPRARYRRPNPAYRARRK